MKRIVNTLALLWLSACVLPLAAQDYNLRTEYRNLWFVPDLGSGPYTNYFGTNGLASTAVFGGSVLDNSTNLTAGLPSDGHMGLDTSSLGQPAASILSDVAIGDVISPPPGFTTGVVPANFTARMVGENPAAYYESPDGGAFYVPSTGLIIASQPNNTVVVWTNTVTGQSKTQVVNVNAVASRRPSKLFWTEDPYDAPAVQLGGLFPAIHYNSEVPVPVTNIVSTTNGTIVTTTTNIVSGVWLDGQKQLHAKGVTGTFLIEYYRDGTYSDQVQPLGVEVVRVQAPDVRLIEAFMGERLLPLDSYWANADGVDGVIPDASNADTDYVLIYANEGPKKNWAFPLKRTTTEPWELEIYWKQKGLMGVQWPYEVDWYSVDWPPHPQLFVVGEHTNRASVTIPSELTASLVNDMDPPLHARLSSSLKSFTAVQPGISMIQYSTSTNIWFDVIRAVSHTNSAYFDPQPVAVPIGQELTPGGERVHAVRFDTPDVDGGEVLGDYAAIGDGYLNKLDHWTLSFWFSADQFQDATLYSEGAPTESYLNINLTREGQIQVEVQNPGGGQHGTFVTTNATVQPFTWHYLTVVFNDASPPNGLLEVYMDEHLETTNGMPRVSYGGEDQTLLAADSALHPEDFFLGKLDELRLWSVALSADQISSNQFNLNPEPSENLIAWFSCDEGQGYVLNNQAGDKNGTLYGDGQWAYGQVVPSDEWTGYPGYVFRPTGTRYNVDLYQYPTEADPDSASHIFAVNTGLLEVWWANQSRNTNMPPVHYPSLVVRYTNAWPSNASQIVIASGLGSNGEQPAGAAAWDPLQALEPAVYYQNQPDLDGYNPNEEHALLFDDVIYALRDDLNQSNSSEPYVLVDYTDADTGLPAMRVFQVLATNALYPFEREVTAGLPIVPILPLGAFPPALGTTSDNTPPAWQDRKMEWWAVAAGNDGGTTKTVMRFYYAVQPGFDFPALEDDAQPPVGSEVPWLPEDPSIGGTEGTPVAFTYQVGWPDDVPKLRLGQTLTVPINGLPDVWDQLSVEIPYQQSLLTTSNRSVTLFDPLVAFGVTLDSSVIDTMTEADLARVDVASGLVRFPNLAPSLYPRLSYDRTTSLLVLEGQRIETLTGAGYLLLNMLEPFEQDQASAAAAGIGAQLEGAWTAAIYALPTEVKGIQANAPYVKAALGALLSDGHGYVTLAFNNSTNRNQVPPALPVSLSVIEVDTNLYSGELEVIEPTDVLAEQLSLRVSPDFAGKVEQCEFRWRWEDPVGGLPPNTNYYDWNAYGVDSAVGTNEVTIQGASPFTLADHYFSVQYRPTNTSGPSGTNWSDWTYNLAPGWVVRAMTGINPFMQIYQDTLDNAVDTRVTMISEAGGPYQGDIALNLDAASEAGLIPTYETIFNRAKEFSLLVGLADDDINQTLLFAASRLNDLYALLGNEAFADAQDPTVAYPDSLSEAGNSLGANGTALFPFMNQLPNVLEEELALLRGRDDTLEPHVTTSPIFNRLIWNFTAGINGGEPAYAHNYHVTGDLTNTTGVISAEDAKRLYPQGHGDAWGHYLSALTKYYDLLAYSIFEWNTEPGATLLGNAAVSTDFLDEQKFAETAAARARTGAQIVQQTYRDLYVEDPNVRQPGYHDGNTNRAWGIADWASRAGQAALYDWATANSLMVTTLTNLTQVNPDADSRPPEGIEKIDRDSTPELREIVSQSETIQMLIDNANGGLNPLGLARDAIPFDIDPSGIDAGDTHFEQIYDRAERAVRNAVVAYDSAREATHHLRRQYDSVQELSASLTENEIDYHNRLIEVFGYPYSDDIGPTGTYPQGYDGPDLVNWQILDLENLLTSAPTGQVMQVDIYNLVFTYTNAGSPDLSSKDYTDYEDLSGTRDSNYVTTVSVFLADNGLKVKPPTWTGSRRAQGRLQLALSDYVLAWYALEAKIKDYDQAMAQLEYLVTRRLAEYDRFGGTSSGSLGGEWARAQELNQFRHETARIVNGFKITSQILDTINQWTRQLAIANANTTPSITSGFTGAFPTEEITINPSTTFKVFATVVGYANATVAQASDIAATGRQLDQRSHDLDFESFVNQYNYNGLIRWSTLETQAALKEQYVKQAELFARVEILAQAYQRIQKLLAEGNRLFAERGQVRSRAAQRIQSARYADLAFRIYRNDALRRYQSTFDLAARYTYLAAKAYDFETGLLSTDSELTPGSQFLEDVVQARLPGRFSSWLGTPMVGGASGGDPGLADVLARMKANWDVVDGRFGFNNPETETSRFSLRTELYRTAVDSSGDQSWRTMLEQSVVADLNQVPAYHRYCRPFSSATNPEPGIVISFPSYVLAGENFFGWPLCGGDNAYDASHAATKIRSVGVWFTGYNTTNTSPGSLANEPRVYLVPAGADILRSPTGGAGSLRTYAVLDQAIPLPYDLGGADIDDPDWSPVVDSLQEPFAQLRQFASFRAYHDDGNFDPSETITASRLIGRSVWNTSWMLIIPGRTLLADPNEGIDRFIHGGQNGTGAGVQDIKIFFQTYSISGD